MISVQSDN